MEYSKVFEGAEECHSSESGWTMYIGSPGDDDDGNSDDQDYDDDDDGGGGDGSGGGDDMNANHEDDSDDSMASDASSGLTKPYGNEQVHHTDISHFKGEEEDEDGSNSKCGSDKKKAKRQLKNQMIEMRRKEEKEDVMFMAKRRVSPSAQSDSKVIRKNVWNSTKRK